MKKLSLFICLFIAAMSGIYAQDPVKKVYKPWDNGKLRVSDNGTYLQHENGTPFFWMGETGWLLPERLDRSEASYYLNGCREAGYNVVQVQTINGVPAINFYGQLSNSDGWDFSEINKKGVYGYWDPMDYIIKQAENQGIYIAMVPIWGGLVKAGLMSVDDAKAYGKFLAERYKDSPNIIWVMGGDVKGDINPDQWNAMARTIKSIDKNHLMSYHPFGRTSSINWFHNAEWLDFNMFQSGHRRYDQVRGDGDDTAQAAQAEDNWRYVEAGLAMKPRKPIFDAEPSYEEIPQGLHDPSQPWWKAPDVRRYAYWAVFAGAFGHTYGHNSIMQMLKPANVGGYGAVKTWYEGMKDPGFNQMKHLKNLILAFPFFERVPDQSIIAGENGTRYDRLIATRGNDYLLVYNYTNRPMEIDLTKISGKKKNAWWYDPKDGNLEYIGEFDSKVTPFQYDGGHGAGNDRVLIAVDSAKDYIGKDWKNLPSKN